MQITNEIAQVFSLWRMVLPAMFLGCLAGNLLHGTRIWRACAKLIAPLTLRAKIPYDCGMYLALCFLNQYAANAFLSSFFREGKLQEGQLLAVFMMGGFPTALYYAIFYITPIIITSAGWFFGTGYIILYLLINFITALIGVLIGILKAKEKGFLMATDSRTVKHFPDAILTKDFKAIVITSLRQFCRVAIIFVPITFGFAVALGSEQFQAVLKSLDPFIQKVGLSAAGVIVIATGVTSSLVALATASSFLKGQLLGPAEMIIALLIAYGFHTIYQLFMNSLPSNIAFFGPKNGFRISLLNNLVRLISIAIILGIIFIINQIANH